MQALSGQLADVLARSKKLLPFVTYSLRLHNQIFYLHALLILSLMSYPASQSLRRSDLFGHTSPGTCHVLHLLKSHCKCAHVSQSVSQSIYINASHLHACMCDLFLLEEVVGGRTWDGLDKNPIGGRDCDGLTQLQGVLLGLQLKSEALVQANERDLGLQKTTPPRQLVLHVHAFMSKFRAMGPLTSIMAKRRPMHWRRPSPKGR